MPSFQDVQAISVILLQILVDAVCQNPCCLKSFAAVTQTCVAWHALCRTSSLLAKIWIVSGIENAANHGRTQRLVDRVQANSRNAVLPSKFFCTDADGELTEALTQDAADSIQQAVHLQLFLTRFDWDGYSTLRVQAIVARLIKTNHPRLNETQITTASQILLHGCVSALRSHLHQFHHYTEAPVPGDAQPIFIRRADVQFAHLKWQQFRECTSLTNGNLNMYFLICVLDFLDALRTAHPAMRKVLLVMHGVEFETL